MPLLLILINKLRHHLLRVTLTVFTGEQSA